MAFCPVCNADVADRDGKCPDCGTLLSVSEKQAQAKEAERSVEDLLQMGMSAIGLGDHRHGIDYLRRASDGDPSHLKAAEMAGAALVERKKFKEAVVYLERAAQLRPDSPKTHFKLGKCLELMQAHSRARQCYERSLQLDATYANAKVALQSLPRDTGPTGPALTTPCVNHMDRRGVAKCISCGHAICRECCRDVPADRRPMGSDPTEVLYFCDRCADPKGTFVRGQTAPTKAAEPAAGTPYNPFAVSVEDLRKVSARETVRPVAAGGVMMFCDTCQCDIVVAQGACPVCGRVLVKDEVAREAETVERTPQEEFDHGMNQIALGEFDHGIRHLKRSVERDPQNKAYARRTAELLFERKMYAESIPYFQRVVDIEPTRPRSHCMLGKAYKGNKQFAEARLCFEAALKLEPAFAIAKVELESLPVEHVAAGPAITSPCINHIDQRAITKCISCGHPLCSECAHDAPEDRRPLGADPTERLYLCEPCLRPKGAYVHGHSEATTFVDASVGAPFNPFGISHEEIRAATGASIEERIAAKKKTLDGTMHPCPVCQSDVFVTAGKCSVCGTLLVEDEVAGEGVQRTPEEEMQHGMDRLSVGDYEHALKHLRRASDRAPDNFKLASQAGTILFERKKYDEAVVYWARAAEVAERSPKAQFRYGRALQAAGKFGMAKKAYEKALELDPSYASAKAALIDLPEEGGPAEAEEVGTCAFHPLKVAMFACADCGKLLCASCVRAVPPGRKTKPMAPGETPYLCDTCLNPSDA